MNFKDQFENETHLVFRNMPESHSHLNGKTVEIIDRKFRGWTKWFYRVKGQKEWFNQGCFVTTK